MKNSKHFLWLSTLFIFGGTIINSPFKNADKLTFLGFLISFILSVVAVFAVYKFSFLDFAAPFLAIYFIGDVSVNFLSFVSKTILKNSQNFWVLLLFVIPIIYFCTKTHQQILNFSLVTGIICSTLLVFFFFATFKDFSFKNIYIYSFPTPKNLFLQALPYIKSITLPCIVLATYAKQQKVEKQVLLSGLSVGNLLLLISIFNSILLFGTTLAGEFEYPYALAISTVTFGNLFSRLDGFSYFIYFVSALIKITVCIKVIKCQIKNKSPNG